MTNLATRQSAVVATNLLDTTSIRAFSACCGGVTASRDGRTILYTRVDTAINDLMLVEDFR